MTTRLFNKFCQYPVLALLLIVPASLASAQEQPVRPLVQAGKTALYQRVIAVPGAVLTGSPGSSEDARAVPPFSTFYVYARRERSGEQWLQVGTDSNGGLDGWLVADDAVDWKQTLTVAFKDPTQQPRTLLFGDRTALKQLIDDEDGVAYQRLREQAEQRISVDSPVVAIQPDYDVDIRRDFYLVPILNHEDVLVGGVKARLLEVASVPLQDSPEIVSAYRTGIVFVIDSTISMGPYIDATRAVMQRVYEAIADAKLSDRISYGLVAYRDNTEQVPGLGFVARTYADLADGTRGETFLSQIEAVNPAPVSSEGFNEDAYAGIREAIRSSDWSDYYARFVVLITDAGPRAGDDALSTTGLTTESIRRLARDKDIASFVFHLKTPTGKDNHEYAETQYRKLSALEEIGDLYYPVETGDSAAFEQALTALTERLTAQVRLAAAGRPPADVVSSGDPATELEALGAKIDRLGYGLRVRYLQERSGQRIPSLFNAWVIDREFDTPDTRALDVRVLLTRDQLSDLYEVLEQVLVRAEEGALAPDDFLDELKSLAASVSRDPQAARSATRTVGGQSLADLGYMREYLQGLPYTSEVMNLDLGIWEQWPAQRQFEFINQLDAKVAYYRALHDNVDLWVSLDGGGVDGDSVYPLLLEALP